MSERSTLRLAVFPLENGVLFPGTSLPLRLTAPRDKRMVEDVLQADRWLVIGNVVDPGVVHPIAGAGKVQLIHGGVRSPQMDILIHGLKRVSLKAMVQEDPYLVMEAELIEEDSTWDGACPRSFHEFRGLVKDWLFAHPDLSDRFLLELDRFDDDEEVYGDLADFVASHFLEDPRDRQTFLGYLDPLERATRLGDRLEVELKKFRRKLVKKNAKRGEDGAFLH